MGRCSTFGTENFQFNYCPSPAAAIIFSLLFGLATIGHLVLAIRYRKKFCWIIIMAGAWETIGLILRVLSTYNPTMQAYSYPSQVLILLAPLWVNAYDYVLLGRMVWYFLDDHRVAKIKARRLALIFVLCDICAFIIQVIGALQTQSKDRQTIENGLHIYMGGIGIQQFFICCFACLGVVFWRKATAGRAIPRPTDWRKMYYVLNGTLVLISIRIIYRLCEFSRGGNTNITTHEAYYYVLDALPTFLALVLLWFAHPGTVLVGPDSEFPEDERSCWWYCCCCGCCRQRKRKNRVPNNDVEMDGELINNAAKFSG
ncbi:hypothetical protein L228DRAFT_257721 [Xylona heveae TC161]|uniref:RTA1 domain protein n=1 Tax=Xylona heveae (strain CBS 132557 / TC161) TaxID=1328760 RepID=A0A165JHJ9_XYLHT|nr:hypothetical protein L228DRAFT_257721 [Xylona heveae TC161]KZF26249.1 hypothetical protein L228DRAFT_257721 [Xylona heveae TC161]